VSSLAGVNLVRLESLIQNGHYSQVKTEITLELKDKSPKDKAILYQLQGDVLKLEGDLDEAYKYWKLSNKYRSKVYKKDDYHLAWNYALLSNYYYEKIEPKLAVAYADSCERLIRGLDKIRQKEIKIFKLWNILGQSYKLGLTGLKASDRLKRYENIRAYYYKSLELIRTEKLSPYYEAKTLHLLGNSYVDNVFEFVSENDQIDFFKTQAENYFKQADEVWKSNISYKYERAKTLYVNALVLSILPKEAFPHALDQSIKLFEASVKVFGLKNNLSIIPNKHDALQCLWLYKSALYEKIRRTNNSLYIHELEKLNRTSIELWKTVYENFKTKNLNQILSIYGLVPYQDVITIENLKRKFKKNCSIDKVFEANQMLKYYDINRFSKNTQEKRIVKLKEVQNQLGDNECFVDFISDHLFLFVTKEKANLVELDPQFHKKLDVLNTSIIERDYDRFCTMSREFYTTLFGSQNLDKISHIHISPAQRFNNLPFEALLRSNRGIDSKKYSKLDYLIRSKQISYYLSASYLVRKPNEYSFTGTALAPRSRTATELPFSEKLVHELHDDHYFHHMDGRKINKSLLFSNKETIFHFSGHGIIDPENPALSKLDFGKDFLSLEEVYLLTQAPPFMILNACNSQNGKTNIGDGVNGFARAFHAIGTQASISNLWEVDDEASNVLFKQFYTNLSEGKGIQSSLRDVQLAFIKREDGFGAPYYWAGHRLVGEISICLENRNAFLRIIFLFTAFAVFILSVLYFHKRNSPC
jgi:hypothetical protein